MKKALIFVLVAILTLSLAGCGDSEYYSFGEMTVVVGYDTPVSYTVDLTKVKDDNGVLSVLQYLSESEGLELSFSDSGYGAYLTKVGDLEENVLLGAYVYVYTSVQADKDVTIYATTIEYNGMTLTSSGLGVSEMTVEDGCTIYIGLIIW
ncbi:MAG: hypothetical protein J6R37_02710 [Clostridia bacterium]|nr:hypothetical protein [Clostridia bacterium]